MVQKTELEELEETEDELEDETEQPLEAEHKYNNRTEESYRKNKIDPDTWPHEIVYSEEHRFLREVDLSKGPIQETVRRMYRVKEVDQLDPKLKRKEFLYVMVDWYGKNKFGEDCAPVGDHIEGWYWKIKRKPVKDEVGNIVTYKFNGQDKTFYIKFEKKNVDAFINKSIGTDKETIKYGVKGPGGLRTDTFTYNQFVYWTWEQCMDALRTKGGPSSLPDPEPPK